MSSAPGCKADEHQHEVGLRRQVEEKAEAQKVQARRAADAKAPARMAHEDRAIEAKERALTAEQIAAELKELQAAKARAENEIEALTNKIENAAE